MNRGVRVLGRPVEGLNDVRRSAPTTTFVAPPVSGTRGAAQALKPLMKVSQSQAEAVAKALGGTWKQAKNGKGYVITIGHPKRPTVIRIMNEGSGQRGQAYFRIAKEGKPAYTRVGNISEIPDLTHLNLYEGDITQQILEVIDKIKK